MNKQINKNSTMCTRFKQVSKMHFNLIEILCNASVLAILVTLP